MTIQLLACDYDGTLTESGGHVLPEIREAIGGFVARGGTFLLASGRITGSLEQMAAPWRCPMYLAAANGAVLKPWPAADRLYALELDADAVRDALALGHGRGTAHLFYDDRFFAAPHPDNEQYGRLLGVSFTPARDLATHTGPGMRSLIWRCEARETPRLAEDLAHALQGRAYVTRSHARLVDVNPFGAGKQRAVTHLQALLGIAPDATLALGDAPNDEGLLLAAAHRAVPANADPELQCLATFTARAPRGAGALECLRHFGVA